MNPGADFVQPLAQSPLAPEQGAGPGLCLKRNNYGQQSNLSKLLSKIIYPRKITASPNAET